MSIKLYEKLLKTFKGARKERKEIIAKEAGYEDHNSYKRFLETTIEGYKSLEISEEKVKEIPTIHIVDILDCSTSMRGGKISNALNGINSEIKRLKVDNKINYTYTLCDFGSYIDIRTDFLLLDLVNVGNINREVRGCTALYDAIGVTCNKIRETINETDKVLVNIYTDGEENDSKRYTQKSISSLIEKLQSENFTITFIGTHQDVKEVIRKINIHESNTLGYDGTAIGLNETMIATSSARSSYSAKVLKGEDVSKDFYKEIIEKK